MEARLPLGICHAAPLKAEIGREAFVGVETLYGPIGPRILCTTVC